ncbi:uncharacterized protein ATC70_000776 [Mucor velutinosus]|uniref:Transmembrane protein n=1 Tax=Mucor velutinosus TaxID=708070 RepID=A0AAN7DMK4_9FUNG|nr:hypothetical protein ATC70_000776 [Mucor velutinosus]
MSTGRRRINTNCICLLGFDNSFAYLAWVLLPLLCYLYCLLLWFIMSSGCFFSLCLLVSGVARSSVFYSVAAGVAAGVAAANLVFPGLLSLVLARSLVSFVFWSFYYGAGITADVVVAGRS